MATDLLPLVVIHAMLEVSGDVGLLKTCRLVSKSWNDICCRILRKTSAVPLHEGVTLEKFQDFFRDRQLYFPNHWPSPFLNFKILNTTLSTHFHDLTRFLQPLNFKITTLEMVHGNDLVPAIMGDFLAHHKEWITHLKIKGTHGVPTFPGISQGFASNWKSLKTVSLKDNCREESAPCPHMQLITALTAKSEIKEIILEGHLQNLTSVFSRNRDCWGKLTRLSLKCERPPSTATPEEIHEFMRWGQELKFPSLRQLHVWPINNLQPYQTSASYAPYILPLIQDCSEYIKELHTPFFPLSMLPSSPKLKFLCCMFLDGDRIQDITELKFPSLTKVYAFFAWNNVPSYIDPKSIVQNQKVAIFSAYWHISASEGPHETLWFTLRDHFPNLSTLWIQPDISLFTLKLAVKSLPHLNSLEFRQISSGALLGTQNGAAIAAKGWPSQYIEKSPLFKMHHLTSLKLGHLVHVSRELIISCLAKLPTLKFLVFPWNNSIETADISLNLGHIDKIKVLCVDPLEMEKLKTLAKTMKNLVVRKF